MAQELDSNDVKSIIEFGVYYNPSGRHYGQNSTNVVCDRCKKTGLDACMGYGGSLDLCIPCFGITYNIYTNKKKEARQHLLEDKPVLVTMMMQSQLRNVPMTKMEQSQFRGITRTNMEQGQFRNAPVTKMMQKSLNTNSEPLTFMTKSMYNEPTNNTEQEDSFFNKMSKMFTGDNKHEPENDL